MNEKVVYTVREVAQILHTSPNYIYDLVNKGYLPAIKLGSIRILKSTLETFLINNEGNDLSKIENIKKLSSENVEVIKNEFS